MKSQKPSLAFKKLVGVLADLKGRPAKKILRELDDEEDRRIVSDDSRTKKSIDSEGSGSAGD